MKTKFLSILLIAFLSISLTQSSNNDCKTYYPLEKGTKWTYEDFNKKGKLTATNTTFVKEINSLGKKTEYIIEASSVNAKPKKGEEPFKQELSYTCEDGKLNFDMSSFIPHENLKAIEGQDIEIDQSEIYIPKNLTVGQVLNDGFVSLKLNGFNLITINITNRKVEKMESITTKAGTYNCALVTYDSSSKLAFMTMKTTVKQWFSSEVGVVKSETYNSKGKLMGSQKLKAFSK